MDHENQQFMSLSWENTFLILNHVKYFNIKNNLKAKLGIQDILQMIIFI